MFRWVPSVRTFTSRIYHATFMEPNYPHFLYVPNVRRHFHLTDPYLPKNCYFGEQILTWVLPWIFQSWPSHGQGFIIIQPYPNNLHLLLSLSFIIHTSFINNSTIKGTMIKMNILIWMKRHTKIIHHKNW